MKRNREIIFCGNWKMNKLLDDALGLVKEIMLLIDTEVFKYCSVAVAPSFPYVYSVGNLVKGTPILLSAQDVHWELEGAYTGEVSPLMLRDLGCSLCIVGHSERRRYFGETDEVVNRKIKALLNVGITPILCVGETIEERKSGKLFNVIKNQLTYALNGVDITSNRIIIAYEPVWAIGTGVNAEPADAEEVHKYIRYVIAEGYGKDIAESITIMYGGSVTPANIFDLMKMENIDGALVGGASLKATSFVDIVYKGLEGKGLWKCS